MSYEPLIRPSATKAARCRVNSSPASAGVAAVARAAGTSNGSLYHRFGDRHGLRRDRPELAPALRLVAGALARGGEASTRLAQVTGAATAKAEEDRLFYRLGRLVSLNEVGGSPGRMTR